MTVQEALRDVQTKLDRLNDAQYSFGLGSLQRADKTDSEWAGELQMRVNALLVAGPSHEVLDALGALTIAWKLQLADREAISFTSGEAA